MNPGSVQAELTRAAALARETGRPALATDLETAASAIADLVTRSHAAIEAAERNADGSETYCIPVEVLDAFSASLARAGGVA